MQSPRDAPVAAAGATGALTRSQNCQRDVLRFSLSRVEIGRKRVK
ncbi:MAG: hypothetical protein Q8M26_18440 [Pseudolabrys sp.]|nr:hypothetical protein [Pseudolabrys sp.]